MRVEDTMENPVRDPEYLDRLMTETEAAQFIGFSIRALQGWRVKGGGPKFVKVSGRAVRYRHRDKLAADFVSRVYEMELISKKVARKAATKPA